MCMSIVASAFQYGCAPTLMPATTMLISPPSWVNSTIRLSAAATQSMFSVPDSIEIRAPADSAYHSSGTRIRSARSSAAITRRHSGSDSAPSDFVGSPSSTTRVTPCGCRSGRRGDHARDDRRGVAPLRPVDRHQRVVVVEVVLDEVAEQAGQLVRVDRVAAARARAPSAGSRRAARPARPTARRRSARCRRWRRRRCARRSWPARRCSRSRCRPMNRISSSPAPAVVGSTRPAIVSISSRVSRSAARRRSRSGWC